MKPGDYVVVTESVVNPHALIYRVSEVEDGWVTALTPVGGSIKAKAARFHIVSAPDEWAAEFRRARFRGLLAWARRGRRRRGMVR